MPVFLVRGVVAVLAWLPLGWCQSIGGFLGWTMWVSHSRMRRVTEINLGLCFPDMGRDERDALARQALIETGKTTTESAWVWRRPREQVVRLVRETRGAELFEQARAGSHGLIVASPHLGNWELCNLPVSHSSDITYLYRPPRNLVIEPLLIEWRSNLGGLPARLDTAGIRQVLKILQSGGIVGVLPDQEPDRANGVMAPFFGVPAHTMTLMAKLASRKRVKVIFCVAERLPKARGWRIHFIEPDPAIADPDKTIAATALNLTVERCISLCPSQYMWNYKRFRLQVDGTRRNYR